MASPNPANLRGKVKWPSQKQATASAADFVPYVSNLVNMFRKVPKPIAPKTIDPVSGTTISLADAKNQVSQATRAADLSTQNLDAQTGAAIRVGNLGNKFRALSDLNSREAQINAQMGQQTKSINANIDAQNAGAINAYHDDITNSQIAQQRAQSENISNAADKFIWQQAIKDQTQLEKDKATIYSKMYTPGVYNRLLTSLQTSGMDTAGFSRPFDTSRKETMPLPAKSTSTVATSTGTTNAATPTATGPIRLDSNEPEAVPEFMRKKPAPKYYMNKFAAGGMMKVFAEDPVPKSKPVTATAPNASSASIESHDMVFADPITRKARIADVLNRAVTEGFHPYNSREGNASVSQAKFYYNPQFASDYTTRVLQVQGDPGYKNMTPEQRLQKYYSLGKGDSEFDKFLKETSSYGGSPSAFYQNSPMKAYGGKVKRRSGGRITKPFAR